MVQGGGFNFKVQFHTFYDAAVVVSAARKQQQRLLVNGQSATVDVDYERVYYRSGEVLAMNSRVMQIKGHPDAFDDLTPNLIRELLSADHRAMERSQAHGYGLD